MAPNRLARHIETNDHRNIAIVAIFTTGFTDATAGQ
jgi:hypothetical protein